MEKLLNAEYGAMAKVPEFAALESTFDLSAQSLTNDMTPVRPDHFFVLLPDNYDAKQRYPVLLFLHGQSMNFQAYVWAFYKNAGHNDWIILFPTIEGWRERQSEWTAFYKRLFEWAQTNYLVDTSRFAVVGHSAGCFDAMRLALHHPQLVKSMVLLAGHWRPGASDVYDALWPSLGTHDIMVHCAENDTLVPMEACRELHRQITIRGNAARFAVGQEMDHFSVLESGSGLHKFVLQWLATR